MTLLHLLSDSHEDRSKEKKERERERGRNDSDMIDDDQLFTGKVCSPALESLQEICFLALHKT